MTITQYHPIRRSALISLLESFTTIFDPLPPCYFLFFAPGNTITKKQKITDDDTKATNDDTKATRKRKIPREVEDKVKLALDNMKQIVMKFKPGTLKSTPRYAHEDIQPYKR